jgi:predicted Zn finger-like uncharacterized protein
VVIECSSCHARFKLADDKVKESGTKVRCTRCREVFTVFPETSPPVTPPVVAGAPVKPVIPVVTQQQKMVDDALFSGTDTPFVTETPPSTVGVPVSEEDDWNQDTADNIFADEFAEAAGASDLDAINFDNIESTAFTEPSEKENKFELADETAFSFTELSLENGTNQSYKIAEATEAQPLSGENDNPFYADDSVVAPTNPSTEDLSSLNTVATESDFSFSGEDNFSDFSWDGPESRPTINTPPEQSVFTDAAPQDTAFDFSSFSFDDGDSPTGVDGNNNDKTVTPNEATIELSLGTETAPAPVETRPHPIEIEAPSPPLTRERHESTPLPARPLRPRVRQKKKGSSRLAMKVIIVILLVFVAIYGVMNRESTLKAYNNIVSSFIENQTRVETSGRIGLIKLSGKYIANSQEGDLFVIRGEAVNEFKGLRSSVLVKGTIFGDNGAALQTQSAYCGNPLRDGRLKNLSFKEIRDVMSNELGENLVNMNIATGKGIPFTIVFNKAPKNIKEFTVEVLESKPGSK